jgi:hypothetical protein
LCGKDGDGVSFGAGVSTNMDVAMSIILVESQINMSVHFKFHCSIQ